MLPATQRGALQAKPMKSLGQLEVAPGINNGHLKQSPHYYEWLFRWRHARVSMFQAAGLAWNITLYGPFRMLLLPRI